MYLAPLVQLNVNRFSGGYGAILGYDSMNSRVLDSIVNPKHLDRFTLE